MAVRQTCYGAALVAAILLTSGCSILPADGPASMDVRAGQTDPESLPYGLVKLSPGAIDLLAVDAPRLSVAFADRRPPQKIKLGIGDIVRVTVFEAGAGGLFIPLEAGVRPGNFVDLPTQQIDNSGYITVPYAPPILAKGRTPEEVQQSIVDALKNRAIEPQVVVTLVEQRTSLISVLGDVNTSARLPANHAGERLLDVIARAGGPKAQGFDTWVMLERNGRRAAVPFGALVYEPSNNIYAHPGDTVFLYREPQTFIAFGASGRQGQIPFDAWRVSLAEGVAKAGGLSDDKADPGSVFVYRGETRKTAEQLGIDISTFQGPIIPVVYVVNFRDPASYFLATKFSMRNKDVIYISNSFAVESTKAMNYFRTVIATVNDPIIAATNGLILRNLFAASTGSSTATIVGGGTTAAPAP